MISASSLEKFAWLSFEWTKRPISGIVIRFQGLGTTTMKFDPDATELEWGETSLLTVVPYQDPWGWMNPRTLHFVDSLVDALRTRHDLRAEVPLISVGGSMGGHAALLYTIKSRHPIAACMALWPVCDLPFHYTERPDLPRTMHHAFDNYEDITDQLVSHSPLHQVQALPDIPYLVVHGEKDVAVKKSAHSDLMVQAMRQRQLRVEYIERPLLGHGGPMDYATNRQIIEFPIAHGKA
jgi:alpha-beta hydrolase superfamily lysophospholipase